MNDCSPQEMQDGTWTLRVHRNKKGKWWAIIVEQWITDNRFRRARFVLDNGPTVLVSAHELQRVVATIQVRGEHAIPLQIDPKSGTISHQKVAMEFEVS
jgi:hypothetical protein